MKGGVLYERDKNSVKTAVNVCVC